MEKRQNGISPQSRQPFLCDSMFFKRVVNSAAVLSEN